MVHRYEPPYAGNQRVSAVCDVSQESMGVYVYYMSVSRRH